jgi:hypothetical protein
LDDASPHWADTGRRECPNYTLTENMNVHRTTSSFILAAIALAAACGTGDPAAAPTGSASSASSAGAAGAGGAGGASTTSTATATATSTGSGESSATAGAGGSVDGIGAPQFDPGELDAASHGGTITFQEIGAKGWYPSRRALDSGECDARKTATCCMTKHDVSGTSLTPWDEDLIMTLRGPIALKQFATYQPDGADAGHWKLVSAWDDRAPGALKGIAFDGNGTEASGFPGTVGSECLVNVSTDDPFSCGPGSVPYCPLPSGQHHTFKGWAGSKLFVLLAGMPHANSDKVQSPCSKDATGNWYDAPWIGLSHGELVRAGAFSDCQCYAKDGAQWWLADGCGQFNVFEVVNDNNQYKNLGVFSTNMFGYAGYVGEGPCGAACDVSKLQPVVDLIDKSKNQEAAKGALASPSKGPGAAFRRPESGYRYFIIFMDVASRTVQLAVVHPNEIPATIGGLLPGLPGDLPAATIDALLALRLPH